MFVSDLLFPPRHHTSLCLLSHILPAFHRRVHVVGMPPSHQSPGFQCTVCDGGLLHFWSHDLSVLVPEPAGPGPVPPTQSVGQVRLYMHTVHETMKCFSSNYFNDVSAPGQIHYKVRRQVTNAT